MKLGTETANIMNWLMANPNYRKPAEGEDVTECMWTDRRAWRVIAVDADGKGATLTRYEPKYVGKAYGDESYEYDDADGNPLLDVRQTMHIRYKYKSWRTDGGRKVDLAWGRRDEYRDPSF